MCDITLKELYDTWKVKNWKSRIAIFLHKQQFVYRKKWVPDIIQARDIQASGLIFFTGLNF